MTDPSPGPCAQWTDGSVIEAVEQYLRLGTLDEIDLIWNLACQFGADGDTPARTPLGVVHLSNLLRVYNSAFGGGLAFAVEVNEPFRLRRAIDAMYYFELPELAAIMNDLFDHDLSLAYAESRERDFYNRLLPDDEVKRGYRVKATETPVDFGLVPDALATVAYLARFAYIRPW